jgi:hypothetical protein
VGLTDEQELTLITFLRSNIYVFAWQPSDMPEVPREVIDHTLEVCIDVRPMKQKPRRRSVEWENFIREEI